MPGLYESHGIRFMYPENWQLEEAFEGGRLTVSVYSPQNAFWSLTLCDGHRLPLSVADEAVEAMRSEYPALEAERADGTFGSLPSVGYDMHFFYLDFVNRCRVQAWPFGGATALVLCQAEDDEFTAAEPVFHAMAASLQRVE